MFHNSIWYTGLDSGWSQDWCSLRWCRSCCLLQRVDRFRSEGHICFCFLRYLCKGREKIPKRNKKLNHRYQKARIFDLTSGRATFTPDNYHSFLVHFLRFSNVRVCMAPNLIACIKETNHFLSLLLSWQYQKSVVPSVDRKWSIHLMFERKVQTWNYPSHLLIPSTRGLRSSLLRSWKR